MVRKGKNAGQCLFIETVSLYKNDSKGCQVHCDKLAPLSVALTGVLIGALTVVLIVALTGVLIVARLVRICNDALPVLCVIIRAWRKIENLCIPHLRAIV